MDDYFLLENKDLDDKYEKLKQLPIPLLYTINNVEVFFKSKTCDDYK